MRLDLVIKNSINCVYALLCSPGIDIVPVLRHSNYNNNIISIYILSLFWGHPAHAYILISQPREAVDDKYQILNFFRTAPDLKTFIFKTPPCTFI